MNQEDVIMGAPIEFSTFIEMHDPYILYPGMSISEPSQDESESMYSKMHYGVASVRVYTEKICPIPLFILFELDRSLSMSDKCKDGRQKIQYVIQSISNILQLLLKTPEAEIYISIHTFDSEIDHLIDPVRITKDNISQLMAMVNLLHF